MISTEAAGNWTPAADSSAAAIRPPSASQSPRYSSAAAEKRGWTGTNSTGGAAAQSRPKASRGSRVSFTAPTLSAGAPGAIRRRRSGAAARARGLGHCLPVAFEDDGVEKMDRVGAADQIALDLVAAFGTQHFELLGRLHAFGEHRDAEAAAEADDRADDRSRLGVVDHVLNEAAVDLDLVEREHPEIAQRRITGAEIVHRDADAQCLQPLEGCQRAGGVLDQQSLGDLEIETRRLEPGLGEHPLDHADQIVVHELKRRQVDGELERRVPAR